MPLRDVADFPQPGNDGLRFIGKRFVDERFDNQKFTGLVFEFCTLEKLGLRNSTFERCEFKHCEFIDCYFIGGTYDQCNFVGSSFDRCNFTWAKYPNSKLDYVKFWRCAPVLFQIREQRPADPQAAAKFFRNLAVEHKSLGNWQEVDRLIRESYRERERHFSSAAFGKNDFYKKQYGGLKRFNYFFRLCLSRMSGFSWGYGTSWGRLARSIALLEILVFPAINFFLGTSTQTGGVNAASSIQESWTCLGSLYKTSLSASLPFIPSAFVGETNFVIPTPLAISEATVGTIFMGLFISLLFRSSSKGA